MDPLEVTEAMGLGSFEGKLGLETEQDLAYVADLLGVDPKVLHDPARYDTIILDRMMPGMDGIQVLANIKDNEIMEQIPVIKQSMFPTLRTPLATASDGFYEA